MLDFSECVIVIVIVIVTRCCQVRACCGPADSGVDSPNKKLLTLKSCCPQRVSCRSLITIAQRPAETQNSVSASVRHGHASVEFGSGLDGYVDDPQAHRREEKNPVSSSCSNMAHRPRPNEDDVCALRRLWAVARLYERVPPLRRADLGKRRQLGKEAQSLHEVATGLSCRVLLAESGAMVHFPLMQTPKCNDEPGGLDSVGRIRPDGSSADAPHLFLSQAGTRLHELRLVCHRSNPLQVFGLLRGTSLADTIAEVQRGYDG